MYKVICFDLDGTLLESIVDIANSMNKVLESYNYNTHSIDAYKTFIGDGAHMLVKRALGNNLDNFDKILKEYKDVYNNNCLDNTFIYDNVVETLSKLKEKYKIAVISNKPHIDTLKVVNHYFPNLFDYISGKQDNIEKKPSNEGMLLMFNALNINNKECLYIGDSHVDWEFACNSKVDCLLLPYGYPKIGFMDTIDNKFKLSSFEDILNKI